MTLLLISCNNEFESHGELITVKLNPAFISLNQDTDVPMNVKGNNVKMSADPNQVIYAIQIYENDSAYYYGLFDEVDSMKIAMTTGKSYHFKVVTYKVGTGAGLKQEDEIDGKYFFLPNKTLLGNKFIKGNALIDINLISSVKLTDTIKKDYPEIDVFYCDKTITLEKGLTNIDFNLLRMGFGVTFSIEGLSNGKLNIIMGNDTTVLSGTTTIDSSIRLFNVSTGDFSTIFTSADSYSDSIPVKVQWIGTNGTIMNTEGMFKFTRNYLKTINIQLNLSNLNLNLEGWSNVVTDIDGNIYHIVTIGTQTWMVENLKVTKYNDGESIPNITNYNDWGNLNTPGYCWYNNDVENKDPYGAMYNWYVVNSKKLSPKGWHVPSNAEWTILTDYLGGLSLAAGKLKEDGNSHWMALNDATNESKFTALPGGYRRYYDGVFFSKGSNCTFWSSTSNNNIEAWSRGMTLYDTTDIHDVQVLLNNKNYGISVRCLKD
jgi:uncharacterized protein (TIGR02145 family)